MPPHQTQPSTIELTPAERDCLCLIARHMIPPSAEHGLPGGDDPLIVQQILRLVDRDKAALRGVLCDVLSCVKTSGVDASPDGQAAHLDSLRNRFPSGFAVIESAVARAYYSDGRVMKSIGMEPRPPFPVGYPMEQDDDWSLLEPVKQRGRAYRQLSK